MHSHITDWLATGEIGLAAARQSGNQAAEACLLLSLGEAHSVLDQEAEALEYFAAAATTPGRVSAAGYAHC